MSEGPGQHPLHDAVDDAANAFNARGLGIASTSNESVNHPAHYGGEDNPYEAIKVIEAWNLGFCLGNTVKYISRAGIKDAAKTVEDLKKARWYLDRRIQQLEGTHG